MSDVKIQVSKNGPLRVQGPIDILDSHGELMQTVQQAALCRCGHSNKKPFCDGMHGKSGFNNECIKAAQQGGT